MSITADMRKDLRWWIMELDHQNRKIFRRAPDIEEVQEVAYGILRHRIVKNYKADAEGISEETLIKKLF